jgi:hypothetical protein
MSARPTKGEYCHIFAVTGFSLCFEATAGPPLRLRPAPPPLPTQYVYENEAAVRDGIPYTVSQHFSGKGLS